MGRGMLMASMVGWERRQQRFRFRPAPTFADLVGFKTAVREANASRTLSAG